jgi:glutaredoxin 3
MTAPVTLYSTAVCPYCVRAERLLEAKGVTGINKIRVDLDPEQRVLMMQKTGRRTVPQIYIGDTMSVVSTICMRWIKPAAWTPC